MAPRYRLELQTFIAPYMLAPGTVIETDAEPGLSWTPLNSEGKSAKDKLFNKEVPVVDQETGKVVKKKINENKRHLYEGGTAPDAERASVQIVSEPPPEQASGLSLAEAALTRGTPDLVPQSDGQVRPATATPTGGDAPTSADPAKDAVKDPVSVPPPSGGPASVPHASSNPAGPGTVKPTQPSGPVTSSPSDKPGAGSQSTDGSTTVVKPS